MNHTLNKLILLLFTLFMFIPTGYAQNNAGPGISILMSPSSVPQGSTGILTALVGNYGNETIVGNSLRVTISVGANTEIIEIAPGSDTGWNQVSLTTGSANTIQLTNSGDYDPFEHGSILLTVRGNEVSEYDLILGNIVYITAKNLSLCDNCTSGPLNAFQGNANSTNDNAQTSLAVTAAIDAVNDTAGPINAHTGGDAGIDVLDNDTLNGVAVVPADVTITSTPTTELTVNADGSVNVTPRIKAGTYTIDYTICENNNPTNCDTATVTVIVKCLPIIDAVNDTAGPINAHTGGDAGIDVLDNDTLKGVAVVLANVTITSTPTTELTVNTDGSVVVTPGIPDGTYTIDYTICENNNPTNCDTATVTVTAKCLPITTPTDDLTTLTITAGSAEQFITQAGDPVATFTVNDDDEDETVGFTTGTNTEDPILSGPHLVRINAGGNSTIIATDGGPNWESTPVTGDYSGPSFSVNTGNNYVQALSFNNKDESIPEYIDENTFNGLFQSQRWDSHTGDELEFTIPLPNGDYTVNLYAGNSYSGTSALGSRIFDILIEGAVVEDDFDLIATFGHRVGGMLHYLVTVNDGVLNISFGHEVENPLINAIEIIGSTVNQRPVALTNAYYAISGNNIVLTTVGEAFLDNGGTLPEISLTTSGTTTNVTATGTPITYHADTDGDGIEDSEDDCPNEAGLAEFNGCPGDLASAMYNADGDGYGIDSRIRVWGDHESNDIIYDNELTPAQNADTITKIGAESIVINENSRSNQNHETSLEEVVFWPNPSETEFNLKLKLINREEHVYISVYDASGKQVYYTSDNSGQGYRFGKRFAAGLYIVKIVQGDKQKTVKLIKR